MDEDVVKSFLRSKIAPPKVIDLAIELYANLSKNERLAIELCARKRLTQEKAAEEADCSVDTMQKWYRSAMKRLSAAWNGCEWIAILAGKQ